MKRKIKENTRFKFISLKKHGVQYEPGWVMAFGKVKDLEQMRKQFNMHYTEDVDYKVTIF